MQGRQFPQGRISGILTKICLISKPASFPRHHTALVGYCMVGTVPMRLKLGCLFSSVYCTGCEGKQSWCYELSVGEASEGKGSVPTVTRARLPLGAVRSRAEPRRAVGAAVGSKQHRPLQSESRAGGEAVPEKAPLSLPPETGPILQRDPAQLMKDKPWLFEKFLVSIWWKCWLLLKIFFWRV